MKRFSIKKAGLLVLFASIIFGACKKSPEDRH